MASLCHPSGTSHGCPSHDAEGQGIEAIPTPSFLDDESLYLLARAAPRLAVAEGGSWVPFHYKQW